MKTKLVYVLTCAPGGTYIEQALMSVYSARYYNQDAHIVLLVDDKTDVLLTGKRAEILKYISEIVIVPFADDTLTPMYRSRWLKTQVRQLVQGDFLFIDSDTIITSDLSLIEYIDADIAMVRDENLDISQHCNAAISYITDNCHLLGVDILKERYYFNSGVIYAKDSKPVHVLYEKWHENWKESIAKGVIFDQPSLAKANIECGHLVALLDDKWNAIVSTHIEEVYSAYIVHFWHSVSFLYSDKAMQYINNNGLTGIIKYYILHYKETFMPPDNHIYHYKWRDYMVLYKALSKTLRNYADYIDASFAGIECPVRRNRMLSWLLRHRKFRMAALIIVLAKMNRVALSSKFVYYSNRYAKLSADE